MAADLDDGALWLTAGPTGPPGGRWVLREGAVTTVELQKVRSLYCATKPMVAMGVLALLERHGVDWNTARADAQGRIHDGSPWAITDLIARRTPLLRPTFWEVLRLPLGRAEPVLAGCAERAATGPGAPTGYSEVLAWYVLARVAARLAGERWAGELQTALRSTVGPRLWLVPDRELLDLPVDAMVALTADLRGADVPLVYALTVRSRALTSPYLGGYGSFAAVVTWIEALGHHLRGEPGFAPLFPDAGRLQAELAVAAEGSGAPAALGLEMVRASVGGPRFALQAAGGALCAELDPAAGVVTAVLGSRFLDDPHRRRVWCVRELAAAREWSQRVGGELSAPAFEARS